jgi:hypothetical protein
MTWMIEISVSIYLYVLLCLTDFMGENRVRDELGWFLTIIIGSVVAINIINVLWKGCQQYQARISIFIH